MQYSVRRIWPDYLNRRAVDIVPTAGEQKLSEFFNRQGWVALKEIRGPLGHAYEVSCPLRNEGDFGGEALLRIAEQGSGGRPALKASFVDTALNVARGMGRTVERKDGYVIVHPAPARA